MNVYSFLPLIAISFFMQASSAKQLTNSGKSFVTVIDPLEFKNIIPEQDGFIRTYSIEEPDIYFTDEAVSKYIKYSNKAVVCTEGTLVKGKKDGLFTVFLIDSADHNKRYKIWEQQFNNNELDGLWKVYSVDGNLVSYIPYKNGELYGISKIFWIDGTTVTEEREYLHGKGRYIKRSFYDNGKLFLVAPYENDSMNGVAKRYYPNGTLKEFAMFKDGQLNGVRRNFYPNAQLWLEEVYKDGKPWTVISNYNETGFKRDAGTLQNGNGTIILYNENGKIRAIKKYKNGVEQL